MQVCILLPCLGGCPSIIKHPADTRAAIGSKVHFECQAIGATPLTYTWLHNGVDMPAKHEKKLELTVLKGSGGEYSCRVENEFGSRKCAPAKLTVGKNNRNGSVHVVIIMIVHNGYCYTPGRGKDVPCNMLDHLRRHMKILIASLLSCTNLSCAETQMGTFISCGLPSLNLIVVGT